MTFKRFEDLLHTKYPNAEACAHGKFGGTEKNKKVEINFTPCGKVYEYYGSYQAILSKVGIRAAYRAEIDWAESRLVKCREQHGKENPYSLFGREIMDYSEEIERLEKYLDSVRDGKYIIID